MAAVDVMRLTGRASLRGELAVVGAKNSALKLMTAALLAPGRTEVTNVPRITDIMIMAEVLRRLGCGVQADGDTVIVDTPEQLSGHADYHLVRRLRASINVLGPLVTRQGYAKVAHPGGDMIGSRGLDMHVSGLARMGAEVSGEHGYVIARAGRLRGASIWLDFPSVGTTENLMMAAALAKGTTVIDNAAREPEVADACAMLNDMGARVEGGGTSTLTIEGVDELRPVSHRAIGDRIIAGTWAYGAAITRGDLTVRGASPEHLKVALEKLAAAGAAVDLLDDGFRVRMSERPRAVDVVTLPYPGLATDLLPMAIALAAVADGVSLVTENVFDGRFMFINEMCRLGADIRTDGHHAVVRGREVLSSAPVRATDIRAGAGLVLAALCADGVTEVSAVHHIDRGYPDFAAELRTLGADVERLTVPDEPDPFA
ncbi:MAG TPA: UDP-N-acetylglucosamine 1-carboxyvinyltransferase [Micromonosporaceae bacterium]